jgi:hypothetical protein
MRIVAPWFVLALALGCQGAATPMHKEAAPPPPPRGEMAAADEGIAAGKAGVDRRPAYRLLDQYAELFRLVGRQGDPTLLDAQLDPQLDVATTLRRDGVVDEAFVSRHTELIEVTRAFLSPLPAGATAEARIREWAARVPNAPRLDAGPLSMATLAPVMVEEIVNLHLMVSGDDDRAATRAALGFTP